ncbi:MerR family transcriptional regulator [Neobacillus massiliamazoniensis]|uniref:MerR family transcriptional regulator n=1 Tax=Neobacillus massiliamazoniensis TaxID=1499688 RepID=A0A0U1NXQ6_9BACI|nr:MerR family transcriptional regulator [Neobacillus massiliamazoniensis]CRK82800.1 MerR family transcriptional regulator [Neobacillus massiliamazoniensis]
MKIGSFAKLFNVSIDTIRYYIELGLLVPEKKGTQFHMNQSCLDDMKLILELKTLQFSLKEIQQFLSYKRLTINIDIGYYKKLLLEKKNTFLEAKKELNRFIKLLDNKLHSLDQPSVSCSSTGVPISFVPFFYCPYCKIPLIISDASILNSNISEAKLTCSCGYFTSIQDGIIITSNLEESPYCILDDDTMTEFNPNFVSLREKGDQWIIKLLKEQNLSNKVVIETNIDVSVSLPKYVSSLDLDTFYIFCGFSLTMIKKLRQFIERNNPKLHVIYIQNTDYNLPLKPGSIDIIIDSITINDICSNKNVFPITLLQTYINQDTKVIGNYLYYHEGATSLLNFRTLYPNSHQHVLYPNYLENNLEKEGLKIQSKAVIGSTDNPGIFLDYHELGEKVNLLGYIAEHII